MIHVFLDESGNLGFDWRKKKTSRYFLVACVIVKEKRPVEKIVRRAFAGFSKAEIKNHRGTLHFYKERPMLRLKILRELSRLDISIVAVILDKKKFRLMPYGGTHALYNTLVHILMQRVCKEYAGQDSFTLVASRRETSRRLNEAFRTHVVSGLPIAIEIKTPQEEKCLQIADGICWALFRKFEEGDTLYADEIQRKILEEIRISS